MVRSRETGNILYGQPAEEEVQEEVLPVHP